MCAQVRVAPVPEPSTSADGVPSLENADAVVVIDPVSTGAVLAYEIVTKRRMQVVCVWSDVVPEELKSFVAKGMEVEFAGRVQVCAPPPLRSARATGRQDAVGSAPRLGGGAPRVCRPAGDWWGGARWAVPSGASGAAWRAAG